MKDLFDAVNFRNVEFKSRIVMPPMTRCRTSQPGNIPNELMAKYYSQRATAGLVIAEATQVSPDAQGYSYTPGIHSREQVDGWKMVTEAVHDVGGKIYVQLWHTGRMSHSSFHHGQPPLAPSAIPTPEGTGVWIAGDEGGSEVRCSSPQAMSQDDIKRIQDDFINAAMNARDAGFDGVELHGGNGYLIDQFLRTSANQRTDEYGGPAENRIRFLTDILDRLVDVFPASQIGVRFSPHNQARGMADANTPEAVLLAMMHMQSLDIGYVHFAEVDWDADPDVPETFRALARKVFKNLIIVAGNYDRRKAEWVLHRNYADMVAFGRPFIANPDLPYRLMNNLSFSKLDNNTLYGGSQRGYTDYPAWNNV